MTTRKFGKVSSNQLYLYALVLYILLNYTILGVQWNYPFSTLKNAAQIILTYFIPFLLCVRFMLGLIKRRTWYEIITVLIIGCALYSSSIIHSNALAYTAAFILLAQGIDYDEIIRASYKAAFFSVVLLVVATIIGAVNDDQIRFTYAWGVLYGHTMGTSHPNNFAAYVMTTLFLWLYMNRKRKSLAKLICVDIIVGVIVFILTASRTSSIVILAFAVIYLLYEVMKKVNAERLINLLKLAIVAVFAVSIYLMNSKGQVGSNGILADVTFATRFSSAYNIYQQYGIQPFGSDIEFVSSVVSAQTGKSSVILDSAYLNLLLYRGYIVTVLFVIAVVLLFRKIGKQREYTLMIIAALFVVDGLMEQNVFMIYSNFSLLYIFAVQSGNLGLEQHSSVGIQEE